METTTAAGSTTPTRETPGGRNHRHEYAADGRLTRLVDPAAPSTAVIGYTYDARGNATSRTSATGFVPNTTAIVVDEANRIRSATVGADTETYTYDGLDRRTRVTTSVGPLMQFYSQAGQPLLWESPGNEVRTRKYTIYLVQQRIARRMTSSLTYIHTDQPGQPAGGDHAGTGDTGEQQSDLGAVRCTGGRCVLGRVAVRGSLPRTGQPG